MQQASVVPDDQVAFLPFVGVPEARLGGPLKQFVQQGAALGFGQADDALGKIAALLGAVGCGSVDVVSCLVHLADLADFGRFNAVYEQHFAEPRPVRTTVGAALLGGALVEITATARRSTPD